jgi:hypothetical protein
MLVRLTSQNQTIGNFFIGKDRILDISAVPVTRRAAAANSALAGIRRINTLF